MPHKKQTDADKDYEDDEHERCPICSRMICPSGDDTCKHYFGCSCDGDIIWSYRYKEFETAWSKLSGWLYEFDLKDDRILEEITKSDIVGHLNSYPDLLVPDNYSTMDVLLALVRFSEGARIETCNMPSSTGQSFYLENFSEYNDTVALVNEVAKRLENEYERRFPETST